MANKEQIEILRRQEAWKRWRKENPDTGPDLRGAKLRGAELTGYNLSRANLSSVDLVLANLSFADLSYSDLSHAQLRGAVLTAANLEGANLTRAHLQGANLRRARLQDAILSGAHLQGVNLSGAELSGANLTLAIAASTTFADIDVRAIQGLESVQHHSPSTIGIDTVYRSNGEIPEAFLRGAGVPDGFITYIRSLVGQAVQFFSCFISYSTKDQDFADRLYTDLQSKGVRCWFAPHDVQGGKKLHEQIDEAIGGADRLLLILSAHSINSEWVKTEIAKARKRKTLEGRQMLFPIRLIDFETLRDWECFDADAGKDSAREIREYFIPDFSNWKDHDSYQKAFASLVRDLEAKAS